MLHILNLSFAGNNNTDKPKTLIINQWLKAGNFTVKPPVFSDIMNTKGDKFSTKELLKFEYIDIKSIKPVAGKTFTPGKKQTIEWMKEATDKSAYLHPGGRDSCLD